MTPKGTKPGQLPTAGSMPVGSTSSTRSSSTTGSHSSSQSVASSSRYTPPIPKSVRESPKWVPILMLTLLVVGVVCILSRYLFADAVDNWLVFVGLGFVLAGLYTATKWH